MEIPKYVADSAWCGRDRSARLAERDRLPGSVFSVQGVGAHGGIQKFGSAGALPDGEPPVVQGKKTPHTAGAQPRTTPG